MSVTSKHVKGRSIVFTIYKSIIHRQKISNKIGIKGLQQTLTLSRHHVHVMIQSVFVVLTP